MLLQCRSAPDQDRHPARLVPSLRTNQQIPKPVLVGMRLSQYLPVRLGHSVHHSAKHAMSAAQRYLGILCPVQVL